MKIVLNTVPTWVCHLCGYLWPARDGQCLPRRCPHCRCCDWQTEREYGPELPGA